LAIERLGDSAIDSVIAIAESLNRLIANSRHY
jgi:hypothetical protein